MKKIESKQLKNIRGGVAPWVPVGIWAAKEVYDYSVEKARNSCNSNPNQWYCIKI